MSVFVIAEFPVHAEQVDAFLDTLRTALVDTRAFEGCEVIDTYVDVDDPGRVILWERWPTKEHHRRYLAWRRESGTGEVLVPFLAGRIGFTYLAARPDV